LTIQRNEIENWSRPVCSALSGVVMYNYLKVKDVKASNPLPTDALPVKVNIPQLVLAHALPCSIS
jgi:hypothetical protein